jgi:radical SAM superfamily enzyme YgiQ (UPF0313 family)
MSAWGWFSVNLSQYAQGQRQYRAIVDDRNHPIWQKIGAIVREQHPQAVGIPYLTPFRHSVERVAAVVKAVDPNIKVIAGAAHPTLCPQEVMQNQDIDFCGLRGGRDSDGRHRCPVKPGQAGLAFGSGDLLPRAGGQVTNNPPPPLIANLDDLPFVAREAVLGCDYDHYRVHCLTTSRGCPYTCAFCRIGNYGPAKCGGAVWKT